MKRRKSWFVLFVLLILIIFVGGTKANDTTGLGVFYGTQLFHNPIWPTLSDYNWIYAILHPTYGKIFFDQLEVYLEGNIGWYNFSKASDVFSLGFCIMTAYDFVKFDKWSLSVECGAGLGYWNKTPSNIIGEGLLGYFQYGAGAKIPIKNDLFLKLAYRFTHTSAIFKKDNGSNSHGILLAINKVW